MNYCLTEIPSVYWINKFNYRCKSCGTEFVHIFPNGDDFVKFQEENGTEVRWLPTYEKGGYLDLVQKLVPYYNPSNVISMKISNEFFLKFRNYVEHSSNGNVFIIGNYAHICPKCHSKELKTIKEIVLTSPPVGWLKISCDLLKSIS